MHNMRNEFGNNELNYDLSTNMDLDLDDRFPKTPIEQIMVQSDTPPKINKPDFSRESAMFNNHNNNYMPRVLFAHDTASGSNSLDGLVNELIETDHNSKPKSISTNSLSLS